nr:ribonuclease H-like domain-containing protein [Tanacetum cinerariifolium]
FESCDPVDTPMVKKSKLNEDKEGKAVDPLHYHAFTDADHAGCQDTWVAERRKRTLIEAARTMLADSKLLTTFWAEAVNTACYVQNRILVLKPHFKTPYELFKGQSSMKTGPSQDYILMPLWKDNSLFDSSSQASDSHNKDKHGPSLDARIFDDAYDDRDEGAKTDYNNLDTGHRQEEGIVYDEVFAPVARIEAIRILKKRTKLEPKPDKIKSKRKAWKSPSQQKVKPDKVKA